MTFQEELDKCIESGFDNFDQFLLQIAIALDDAGIKLDNETTEAE